MFSSSKNISGIVEGLKFNRGLDDIDESFEELREEYSPDITEDYNYEIEDSMICNIDEAKTVTFGGKTYPKFGWAVTMAGGSGLI